MEIWKGKEDAALKVLTLLVKENVKNLRVAELNPERVKRSAEEISKRIGVQKEELLSMLKIIVEDLLLDTIRQIEKIEFRN